MYYYPYGEIHTNRLSNTTDYLYTGKEWDSESGLYYYGARYYDPRLARFVSADTIIPDWYKQQSLNRYSYAINNPLKYNDPSGHIVWDVVDFVSFTHSAYAFAAAPSWANAGWLAADALGLLPGIPGAGIVKAGIKGAEAASDLISASNKTSSSSHIARGLDSSKTIGEKSPKTRYRGGKYSELDADGFHRHHMPSKQSSNLNPDDGPAIQMEPADHRRTKSYGGGPKSAQQEYRNMQRQLINEGKFDDAFLKDVDDIQSKFGDKYDDAILEAIDALPE